ncbi:tetratricopeptide repeat protein [Sphingopyxis sp.]|uniref:tetratricopeptide repeat protein n=1 Tax=Sphingopyxis sp. TaxID=1908224 RepID=UPI0035B4938D
MATLDIDRLKAMSAEELSALFAPANPERPAAIRLAAEAGFADAQAIYGQMLLDGDGVPQNQQAAIGWFHKAAEQGHAMAINMIGRCYDLGWGVDIDKARAAEWFRLAADRGLDWGLYNYATLLALGQGVAEDKPAALDLFRRAAAMGNAKAINFVGSFHEDGWVVERNLAVAADHYRRAAEGGDFRGRFNHARMLADVGDIDGVLHWLGRVGETATPAFMEKAKAWLAASDNERLRTDGVAALVAGQEAKP